MHEGCGITKQGAEPRGNRAVEVLGHGVLLCLWSPLPDSSLAGQEHGRTIPLGDMKAESTERGGCRGQLVDHALVIALSVLRR
jgi:hypothetical protein